jgi:hypothetical protein
MNQMMMMMMLVVMIIMWDIKLISAASIDAFTCNDLCFFANNGVCEVSESERLELRKEGFLGWVSKYILRF